MTRNHITCFLVILTACWSCRKFVDTPVPSSQITPDAVFNNDASATAALLGGYYSIQNQGNGLTLYGSYFADELVYLNAASSTDQAISNTYDPTTDYGFFTGFYKTIYNCNAILEALKKPTTLSDSVKTMATGESKFLRAYSHFRLTNLYGAVPLITTTDVTVSAQVGNTPVAQLYDSIVSDLKDAYAILPAAYPSADRVRANKWAAGALLARVYLYRKDWANAATIASQVIGSSAYSMPADLNAVFVKNSPEVIWQLWMINGYTGFASTILPQTPGSQLFYFVRPQLVNAFSAGDLRKSAWLKSGTGPDANTYYPYKYKLRTTSSASAENLVVLRLAEQYLIRAEALAHQGNISGGLTDVNTIRHRAGLADTTAADAPGLLGIVEQERRCELMLEEGHRWSDLVRTGRASYWLAPVKPSWQPRDTLLPIPVSILMSNSNLNQTPGY